MWYKEVRMPECREVLLQVLYADQRHFRSRENVHYWGLGVHPQRHRSRVQKRRLPMRRRIQKTIKRIWRLFRPKKELRVRYNDETHPERLAVLPYCSAGRGIDVGCGYRKSSDNCIGVDLTPRGELGTAGVVKGRASVADITASADALTMFGDGELDFVVARHNLEHYVDVIKTLDEWKRLLKPGGVMAVVLPDERALNTIALDPTHKHCFTPDSFDRYMRLIGGFEKVKSEVVVEKWSFVAVYRRLDT